MVKKILELPPTGAAVPRDMWLTMVDTARRLDRLDLMWLIMQVDRVRISIGEEAHEIATKGRDAWKDPWFQNYWLHQMWFAVHLEQADLVELYLSYGMTVELSDPCGATALHKAAEGREKEHLVRLLLEKYQADPNNIPIPRSLGWTTPLILAAGEGSTKVVKLLLEHKADPCNGEGGRFCRALAEAAANGHKDVVKILLQDERIDLNAMGTGETTVLAYSVKGGYPDMVQMLLQNRQIDPNATASDGRSPLLIAARGTGFRDPERRKISALAITKLLLSDKRVDIFTKNNSGGNALFWAVEGGQHEILKIYLNDGKLDPNETDNDECAPVSFARDEKCLELLINDTRVDLNMADFRGMTPLIQNFFLAHANNVKQLLDSGRVDVNWADNCGNTAIMRACDRSIPYTCESDKIVRLLLGVAGLNLDLVNAKGETALMVAVKNNYVNAVGEILLTGNCMVDMKDANGLTMMEYAIQADSTQIIQLLLDTNKVRVTQGSIESAQSQEVRDMLGKYIERRRNKQRWFKRLLFSYLLSIES